MARIYLRSTQKLFDNGNASPMEFADAQSKATGAQAGLENARRNLDNCRVSAPISGYIAQKEAVAVAGGAIAGGTLVSRVVDLSALKTIVPVGEMEVSMLKPGMAAAVRVPAVGDTVFAGQVSAIGAGANPATGSYPVEVSWPNTAERRVKSGMSVNVKIPTHSADSVVMVPLACMTQKEHSAAVLVATRGEVAVRFVETGRTTDVMVEVVSGVHAGDTVLTSGTTTLSVGDPVVVTLTKAPQ
jgi:membrane fusion protein (multidrug efflux system)